MWPFKKKPPPAPTFVESVIKSLKEDPDAWTLSEGPPQWVECSLNDKRAHRRGYGDYVRAETPLKLVHKDGKVELRDPDAIDYGGWVIAKPKHIITSSYDSRELSTAVEEWRKHKMAESLKVSTPEQDALAEALEELEKTT